MRPKSSSDVSPAPGQDAFSKVAPILHCMSHALFPSAALWVKRWARQSLGTLFPCVLGASDAALGKNGSKCRYYGEIRDFLGSLVIWSGLMYLLADPFRSCYTASQNSS